ncbi:MAG: hypothetical protein S4CHLAM102_06620 [Chlamydiia bacterium]|nr:hypothetical protein [Chlamydiia bacterium]
MYALGIHSDGDYMKCALIKGRGKRLHIECLEGFDKEIFNTGQLEKALFNKTGIDDLFEKVPTASALSSKDLFIRSLKLPLTKKEAIYNALKYQVEEISPFQAAESTVVPLIAPDPSEKGHSRVTMFAFRDEVMQTHIDGVKGLGIKPSWVACVPTALQRFAGFFAEGEKGVIVFYFGWSITEMVLVIDDMIISSTHIEIGLKDFYHAMSIDSPDCGEFDLDALKEEMHYFGALNTEKSNLYQLLENYYQRVSRAMEYFAEQEQGTEVGILYTGFLDAIDFLENLMGGFNRKPIEMTPHLNYSRETLSTYAIEIGLALNVMNTDKNTLQLRVGKWMSSLQVRRAKMFTKRYLAAIACTTLLCFGFSNLILLIKENQLKEHFQRVLTESHIKRLPIDPSRLTFLDKLFVSRKSLSGAIEYISREMTQEMAPASYLAAPPTVSGLMEGLEVGLGKFGQDFHAATLDYALDKHPSLDQPKEAYMAKVVFGYEAKNRQVAEKVYARLKELSFVDKPSSLAYNHKKECYEVTFEYRRAL